MNTGASRQLDFRAKEKNIQFGTNESDECPAKLNVKYAIIILWLGRHLATNHLTEIMQKSNAHPHNRK